MKNIYSGDLPEPGIVKAVRIENFRQENWQGPLQSRVLRRYPNAKIESRNTAVALVRLNATKTWGAEDEAFFAELRAEELFQRWEPLSDVPPAPKHNKAVYEDIGYRVGAGERLTVKQQEVLLSQLHNLEDRAFHAEQEAKERRIRAEILEEDIGKTLQRHNAIAAVLNMLDKELRINVQGDINEPCTLEDRETGRVLLRNAPLTEVYQTALRYRLKASDQS